MLNVSLLKKIFLSSLGVILLCLIFWQPIAAFGIKSYIKHLSNKYLDANFEADAISFEKGKWVIQNPRMQTKKKLAEGGGSFQGQEISIEFIPRFIRGRLDIIVSFAKPEFSIQKILYNDNEGLKPLVLLGFIDLSFHCSMNQGELLLYEHEESNKNPILQKLFFQFDADFDTGLTGRLAASLDDPALKKNCLIFSFDEKTESPFAINFSFDEVECPSLLKAASSFIPSLQGVYSTQGIIKGNLAVTLPGSGHFYAEGEMTIKDLIFSIPELEMDGKIKEAHIRLDENKDPRLKKELSSKQTIPRTIGHIEIAEEGILTFNREGSPFCEISDLKGAVYFQTQDGARLAFKGKCLHREKISNLQIGGEARFATESDGSLHLSISLGDDDLEKAEAKFFTRQLGSKLKFAEISFINIGPSEFEMLMAILASKYPESRQVSMAAGKIDATALAFMKGLRVTELKIEKISAQNLQFNVDPWEWTLTAKELSGNLAVNLDTEADKTLDTLSSDLLIKNGQVKFATFDHDFCHLSDVQTELTIRHGTILESLVEGEFAGLKGQIFLNGLSPDGEIVKFNFSGGAMGMASVIPEPFRSSFKNKFQNDQVLVKGGVCFWGDSITVEGKIEAGLLNSNETSSLEFGFDLNKTSEKLWSKWPPNYQTVSYWQNLGREANLAYFPALAAPAALYESKWLLRELGFAGFVIRDGWFLGQNLPLGKFAAPFLFPENDFKLEGYADIQGEFDHSGLALQYDFSDLTLENKDLIIEIKSPIDGKEDRNLCSDLPCLHFFDCHSGKSFGTMPIYNGSCFEKNSGLLFSEIGGMISFNGKKIIIDNLQTSCTGLYFAGQLETDLSNQTKGLFDVDIKAHTIKGKFSQLQHFLSHFEKLKFFQKFPIEGNLELLEEGLTLHFGFNPSAPMEIQTTFKGKLAQGFYTKPEGSINVKNLEMSFDYDQAEKSFEIQDIAGTLTVGQGSDADEYAICGDQIYFSNIEKNEAQFDLWIGDSKRDIFRVVGKTNSVERPELASFIQFAFDKELTHFGDVYPKILELSLKNWLEINEFKLAMDLSLATLLNDLQAACRTDVFNLPPSIVKEINNLKVAKGLFSIDLKYDSDSAFFTYEIHGGQLSAGPHRYQKCCLQGFKRGGLWTVEQLVLDDLSLAADLHPTQTGWKIDFLGLKYGESLLVGLEGEYREGDSHLDAKVNLLEINFSKLGEWPILSKFMTECNPKGNLKGSGKLKIEIDPTASKGWRLNAQVQGGLKDWQFKGLHFSDVQNVSFHLISEQGIRIQKLKTSLLHDSKGEALGELEIKDSDYLFSKDELIIDSLLFDIPFQNLQTAGLKLQEGFPDAFPEKVVSVISQAKEKGNLAGSFKMFKTPSSTTVEVGLQDGNYRFLNQEHQVKNFLLQYDLKELKIQTLYQFNSYPFWLTVKTKGPEFNSGVLLLSDSHPTLPPVSAEKYPLRIDWKNLPETGFQVYKALGHLGGMAVNLTSDPEIPFSEESLHFVGELGINPSVSSAFISEHLCQKMKEWRVEEGYRLNGHWSLSKKEKGNIRFDGALQGYDFTLKGYQFQKMNAKLHYQPKKIHLQDIEVEDPAGLLKIAHADIYQLEEGDWAYHIPKLSVLNFKPSLLHETGQPAPLSKPLVVRLLEIENLIGYCDDINTLTGKGKLQFINPPKKNLQNTILAIPAEILTMIGLDLTVLNPVSGTIFYEINQSKVVITKFKDIYSEGKLSKFHLGNSEQGSYVDFDGKLHISIKMKQYNLFFKLAELFTFNIGGTLQKPTYSLQTPRQDKKQN